MKDVKEKHQQWREGHTLEDQLEIRVMPSVTVSVICFATTNGIVVPDPVDTLISLSMLAKRATYCGCRTG